MTKTEEFNNIQKGIYSHNRTLFRPILMHFAARYSGKTYGKFASDYKTLVECNIKALEDFDLDMIGLLSDPYRETSAFGAQIEFIPEGVPKCLGNIVNTYEDVKNLRTPDVYKAERTLDRINAAKYACKILKGNVPVIGWVEGPLAEACDLVGVGNMLLNLMTAADFSNALLDKCVVTAKEFATAQINEGCQVIGIGDAICSQIDPITYETFVKERQKEIVKHIHKLGAKVKLHICGDINHLIPNIKDLNIDILDCDWQVNLDKAHDILGQQTILCGNINPVDIQEKSEEELYNQIKTLIEKEKNKPFILSGGCEITVDTPPNNLHIMRKASIY